MNVFSFHQSDEISKINHIVSWDIWRWSRPSLTISYEISYEISYDISFNISFNLGSTRIEGIYKTKTTFVKNPGKGKMLLIVLLGFFSYWPVWLITNLKQLGLVLSAEGKYLHVWGYGIVLP
jgi:hypothetical protein